MRSGFLPVLFAAWFAAGAGRVAADIVVTHPPLNSGGPVADTEFINSSDDPSWQQLADDFQVTQTPRSGGFRGGDSTVQVSLKK